MHHSRFNLAKMEVLYWELLGTLGAGHFLPLRWGWPFWESLIKERQTNPPIYPSLLEITAPHLPPYQIALETNGHWKELGANIKHVQAPATQANILATNWAKVSRLVTG